MMKPVCRPAIVRGRPTAYRFLRSPISDFPTHQVVLIPPGLGRSHHCSRTSTRVDCVVHNTISPCLIDPTQRQWKCAAPRSRLRIAQVYKGLSGRLFCGFTPIRRDSTPSYTGEPDETVQCSTTPIRSFTITMGSAASHRQDEE